MAPSECSDSKRHSRQQRHRHHQCRRHSRQHSKPHKLDSGLQTQQTSMSGTNDVRPTSGDDYGDDCEDVGRQIEALVAAAAVDAVPVVSVVDAIQ